MLGISTVGLLWWWGYYFFIWKDAGNTQTTQGQDIFSPAFSWDLVSSIRVLWETTLLNEQKLKFNIEWTLTNISVKEGDRVQQWDILATLDTEELRNELKEAQINLENAKINLQTELDKLSWEEKVKQELLLESQQRRIELAEYDYQKQIENDEIQKVNLTKEIASLELTLDKLLKESLISKETLVSDIKDTQQDLEYKHKTLEDRKWDLEKQISDEKRELEIKIRDYNNLFTDVYEDIDQKVWNFMSYYKQVNLFLGFDSEEPRNFVHNIYFSVKEPQYKVNSEKYYSSFKANIWDLKDKLKDINKSTLTLWGAIELLEMQKQLYENMYQLWDNILKWTDESIEAYDFWEVEISTLKSLASNLKTTWYSLRQWIDPSIDKLKNSLLPSELQKQSNMKIQGLEKNLTDLDKDIQKSQRDAKNLSDLFPEQLKQIEQEIDQTQTNLTTKKREVSDIIYKNQVALQDREFEIKTQKQDYTIALRDFSKKYENIKETQEIKLLENALKQAQIAIDQVNKKIENYHLIAPFDWVIDFINLKVWDKLANTSADEKYIHLINPNMIEIKIKLDQIDIIKVEKGMEAQVNFDSYPDRVFTWTLDTIDSKPIDENGMKKYQVKMVIDKWDLNIFSGMSANVDIIFEQKLWVILVPTMSIESDNETWETYVTILRDGKKEKQVVEIWLANHGNTEILSWVELWEQVLEINFDANQFQIEDFSWPWFMY